MKSNFIEVTPVVDNDVDGVELWGGTVLINIEQIKYIRRSSEKYAKTLLKLKFKVWHGKVDGTYFYSDEINIAEDYQTLKSEIL